MDPILVLVTARDADEAARLARVLVDERLAACVNIVPGVRSLYRWQGRVEDAPEVLLLVKSVRPRLEAIVARVRALHSYSVPEVIAMPITGGSEAYLAWLAAEAAPEEP
ncbi:MAG: divalent-cation tolerance protein CutA [Armatimonadota bacterium]|nr:divalent-cation tolerance protein CutA [Armatimonadota bacterium]MDR7420922.1 divalent-cation tolerance protein CutA [Armatimonadota bacterium]MDR7453661.1 divalent-cation tolerance protein CutA [Armatimonadota bacterium]MDR7457130.1 divalent-cation tolerance protein CutA [Armatimonadota bacterium]MDR7497129.1 divalent-cation tolerance protein CutA [Armatimonadota bacterium]